MKGLTKGNTNKGSIIRKLNVGCMSIVLTEHSGDTIFNIIPGAACTFSIYGTAQIGTRVMQI